MRAATCKVAQVAAQRLRPGRLERLTAKAPGFAGGYFLTLRPSSSTVSVRMKADWMRERHVHLDTEGGQQW